MDTIKKRAGVGEQDARHLKQRLIALTDGRVFLKITPPWIKGTRPVTTYREVHS